MESCPKDVFLSLPRLADVSNDQPVLCFYPFAKAMELEFPLAPIWSETDSLVDAVCNFAENEAQKPSPQIECYTNSISGSIVCKFGVLDTQTSEYPSLNATTASDIEPIVPELVSAADEIYQFIRENGQVSTNQIQELGIVKRRQMFNVLKQLENESKIQKVGHGQYIALESAV